jgi:hypothetical protein
MAANNDEKAISEKPNKGKSNNRYQIQFKPCRKIHDLQKRQTPLRAGRGSLSEFLKLLQFSFPQGAWAVR